MKSTIYIETTVISYYTANPSRDLVVAAYQEATREMWPKFGSQYECYISTLVHKETSKRNTDQAKRRMEAIAPFKILDVNQEARTLADSLILERAVPDKFPEDALHIAVCAVNGVDILLTWNFAHINNPFTRILVRQVIESGGYECPEICSPNELLEVAT